MLGGEAERLGLPSLEQGRLRGASYYGHHGHKSLQELQGDEAGLCSLVLVPDSEVNRHIVEHKWFCLNIRKCFLL